MAERPRLLFVWELGGNFGHAAKVVRVAGALADRYDIVVAAQNPVAIRQMAPELQARVLAAPVAQTRRMRPDEADGASFPGVLMQDGWDDPTVLGPLVEAWRTLFDLVGPDVIIAQSAPTALLAARGTGVPRVILGSGYDNPPRAAPMPLFYPEKSGAAEVAARQEAAALATANAVLAKSGVTRMAQFADLLKVERSVLVTWPETDHYADRAAIEPDHPPYLGHVAVQDAGAPVAWAGRGGPRIFAYLRPGSPESVAAFGALLAMAPKADVIIAAPGIVEKEAQLLRSGGAQVVDGPARLGPLLPQCDLGISHCGSGTVAALFHAGVRQLFLPTQMEQSMLARAMGQRGFGLGIIGRYGKAEVAKVIAQVIESQTMGRKIEVALEAIQARGEAPAEERAAAVIAELLP